MKRYGTLDKEIQQQIIEIIKDEVRNVPVLVDSLDYYIYDKDAEKVALRIMDKLENRGCFG